jgi:hypothetical protein
MTSEGNFVPQETVSMRSEVVLIYHHREKEKADLLMKGSALEKNLAGWPTP